MELREDPEWVTRAARAHVHYRVAGMEQVVVRRNTGPVEFDLYSPAATPAPCVILIHGGPLPPNLLTTPKDWGWFQSYGRLLAASGMAAVMFNHRFFGPDKLPEAIADTQDVFRYVRENGETLQIDPERLCLWVFSGGGPIVSPFLRETPDALRCVVTYYADLHAPAIQLSENSGRLPALLIARAGLDHPKLNESADFFIQQALKKNADLDVLNHASGQHGFDCRDDNARTHDILRRTIEFLHAHL
ncbi:MAG: alpha/beta hydrolase [Acidobacteriota bacterium]|nr:alpha/beta hydrolase [Acidobacteriota bacterium]